MMAPVVSDGVDTPVWEIGQWIATLLTFGLALFVIIWVATICRRSSLASNERISTPSISMVPPVGS